MIRLDTYLIASIVIRLKQYLDYKRIDTVRKQEIFDFLSWTNIMKVRKTFDFHQKKRNYTSPIFTRLSNLYESRVIDIDTIMAFILDYYVRTGEPMNYTTKITFDDFRERLRFLSVLDVNEQLDKLKALHEEYSKQSKFNKFSGNKLTLFGVNEKQENKLYELVKNGEESYLLYAYFMSIEKFSIDESKIDDLAFLKFVKIIKYIIKKQIKIEKIKYEV